MDGLISQVGALKLDVAYESEPAGFAVWLSPPLLDHTSADISVERVRAALLRELRLEDTHDKLPQLKAVTPAVIRITPFASSVPAEPKPNLLVLLASIFRRLYLEKPVDGPVMASRVASLLDEFHNRFDVLIPRGQLKKIMTEPDWEMFACRPIANGPLYIDRVSSYDTNPGAVGMQFEKAMVDLPANGRRLHRVYAVRYATLGGLSLALTGEVDCVDAAGDVAEIKSKPSWARNDPDRLMATWVQSHLGGVREIVTGEFTKSGRGRYDPVQFPADLVRREATDSYGSLSKASKKLVLETGYQALKQLQADCKDVGVVYRVSGGGRRVTVRSSNTDFAISAGTVKAVAEATILEAEER